MIEKLRDEIVESMKVRNEFLKWKLILIAVVGGAGLGIGSAAASTAPAPPPPLFLLAFIPFLCLYVDAVCIHNEIRILLIAKFLRTQTESQVARDYEQLCRDQRKMFSFEGLALLATSVAVSILVILLGCCRSVETALGIAAGVNWFFVGAGTAGLVANVGLYGWFQYRCGKLDDGLHAVDVPSVLPPGDGSGARSGV